MGSRIGYPAEASISEEPGAIIPHAGIRAGGGRVTALPTATKYVPRSFQTDGTEQQSFGFHKELFLIM